MANIAISELESESNELKDNDLILVSNDNGNGSYTSMKMKGSVLKSGGTTCGFDESKVTSGCTTALNNKGVSTLTSAQVTSACTSSLNTKGVSTLTASQVQSSCESAITNKNVATSENVNSIITSALTSNTEVSNVLYSSATKGLFIDFNQIIIAKLCRKCNSDSMPFDCVFYYKAYNETKGLDNPPLFDDIDRHPYLNVTDGGFYQTYVEKGTKVTYNYDSSKGNTTIAIVPLTYGRTNSTFKTYSLYDFMTDSDKYSELQGYFSTMEVYGGNNATSTVDYTLIDTKAKAQSLTYKYYYLKTQIVSTDETIIAMGGGGATNYFNNKSDFYLTEVHTYNTLFPVTNIRTSKLLFTKKQYAYINFTAYPRSFSGSESWSSQVLTKPISFYDNIQISKIEGLTFN